MEVEEQLVDSMVYKMFINPTQYGLFSCVVGNGTGIRFVSFFIYLFFQMLWLPRICMEIF